MNIKNKHNAICLDYAASLAMKRIGIPQDTAAFYWPKGENRPFPADRVTRFKGWESHFTAAFTAEELAVYLPAGAKIEKLSRGVFSVSHPSLTFSGVGTLAGSIARFLIHLHKKGKLKI